MKLGGSCAHQETSMADDLGGIISEMKMLRIAIGGVNPDPQETIQAYRDRLAAQQRAADHLVTATEALVRATSRLGLATWVLVVLTAVLAVGATLQLLGVVR
jgi:hypothetical protein